MDQQSRWTAGIMASRNYPHAPFGISAEQLPGMGKLRPSPPTEQAVDREVSLDAVDQEQLSVLARKPGLPHDRGDHLLSAALDDARRQIFATVDTQVKRRFPTRESATIREASRAFSASSHTATSSST